MIDHVIEIMYTSYYHWVDFQGENAIKVHKIQIIFIKKNNVFSKYKK